MKLLEPDYVVPTRKTMSAKIKNMHSDGLNALTKAVRGKSVALTTDHWTSGATESFMTVTIHYIDDEWILRSCVLHTIEMPESHTAQNIADRLIACSAKFEINPKNIIAIVRDGAANMGAAMRKLKESSEWDFESVECVAHILQKCIKAALELPSIDNACAAARKLVGHFKHSVIAKDELKKQQLLEFKSHDDHESKPVTITQEVKTRWNRTNDMAARLVKLRWHITKVKQFSFTAANST